MLRGWAGGGGESRGAEHHCQAELNPERAERGGKDLEKDVPACSHPNMHSRAHCPRAPLHGPSALTRKLLSLGLVARLSPRRMLSFLSDTLDSVTLPSERGAG